MRFSPPLPEPPVIAATALWLPPGRDLADDALAAGRMSKSTAAGLAVRALPASEDLAPPEMAVLAARKALAEAGWSGRDIGMVIHSWVHYQGHDYWSPAHYVAHQVDAQPATAVGIQQTCNGSAAALEVAATRLAVDPSVSRCLLTTGERFCLPGFDRWQFESEMAFADSGTALLLQRGGPGQFRLLSVVSVTAPQYEVIHRGATFGTAPDPQAGTGQPRRQAKQAWIASGGLPGFKATKREQLRYLIQTALAEAELTPDDPRVRYVVLGRTGSYATTSKQLVGDAGLRHPDVLNLYHATGHLGPGDLPANLVALHDSQLLTPGQVALLLSAGGGFTRSCIAVSKE